MIDVARTAAEVVPVVITYRWSAGEIAIVLAAVTTTVVTIISAWSSSRRRNEAKVESAVIVEKADVADKKLDHIKELTNSTLTTATREIKDLRGQNDRLEKMLDRLLANGKARETTRTVIRETTSGVPGELETEGPEKK